MNEQLKFSWGHIIAFFALIVVSYITFIGVTYLTNGNFVEASITMFGIDFVLLLLFIGAQIAKATTKKFSRWILFERTCIFISPIIFILVMIPYFHFWTVHNQNTVIVNDFTTAIHASKQMFTDYENYAYKRIENYEQLLDRIIVNKDSQHKEYEAFGFTSKNEEIQKENMITTLRLQLLSVNYYFLKNEAIKWIEQSNNGASTWNAFLLGNTKEIKKAIHDWNILLSSFSEKKLSNEEFGGYNHVENFNDVSNSLSSVDKEFEGLSSKFTERRFPHIISIITAFIFYFALLFPYMLQDRHTKSQYRLICMKKGSSRKNSFGTNIPENNKADIQIDESISETNRTSGNNNNDDFASFTI